MLYNRLHFLRERLGLTQKELAKLLNIKNDGYCHYEKENFIIPIKHLNTLCNYFNVSLDYIFNFTDTLNYEDNTNDINKCLSGTRLKEFRKENKITQEKLAKILNISRTTITEYERGTNIIATPFLYELCKKYNLSADYLLGKTKNTKYFKTY